MHQSVFPSGRERADKLGQLIHSDVCGPLEEPSLAGTSFFVTFKDDFNGWCTIFFMKTKSKVEQHFRTFVARFENEKGRRIKTLCSENGGELVNKSLGDFLALKGIRHEKSAPYIP